MNQETDLWAPTQNLPVAGNHKTDTAYLKEPRGGDAWERSTGGRQQ